MDLAYEGLAFRKMKFPEITGRCIEVRSFSKHAGLSGLRIGYIVAERDIIEKIRKEISITVSCVPGFIQEWLSEKLEKIDRIAAGFREEYKKRARVAYSILSKHFDVKMPDSGFYIFPNVGSGIRAHELMLKKGWAVMPGEFFGKKGCMRISLVRDVPTIRKALDDLVLCCSRI